MKFRHPGRHVRLVFRHLFSAGYQPLCLYPHPKCGCRGQGKASHRERIVKSGNGSGEGDEGKPTQVEVLVDEVEQIARDAMAEDARPRAVTSVWTIPTGH